MVVRRYLTSLFFGGITSGMALTLTNSIMFDRFAKLESNTVYLGRDVPGQIGGLFFSLLVCKFPYNPRTIGVITAISLPMCVYLESKVGTCSEEHIIPLIVSSSFLKSLAFTGPVGAHSVALLFCSKSNSIASLGVQMAITSGIGVTAGTIIGLGFKEHYNDYRGRVSFLSSLFYPMILFLGWRRMM